MGINPTLPNFKTFTFGGVNSATYGVYITGEGVFNAPERNVEMIEIAGRNGAYALDKGNFLNIEVTYPASIATDNETDFAEAVSDLRNFLCSKVGYVRLEDDYNTGEYRLAIYKSGLEVSHDMLIAGEFDIVFECKPQRYLTSGETAQAVASGGTITNPTLFDAKPQIQVWGDGSLSFNGKTITVNGNDPIGSVIAFNGLHELQIFSTTFTIDDTYASVGDTINCGYFKIKNGLIVDGHVNRSAISASGDLTSATNSWSANGVTYTVEMSAGVGTPFIYGTTETRTGTATIVISSQLYGDLTATATVTLVYDGADSFTLSFSETLPTHVRDFSAPYFPDIQVDSIILNSSQYALGTPIYIDLDIGEAYKIENGSFASLNNAVQIPAELPTLASGANTITYDNTFTQVKILPRWWKV